MINKMQENDNSMASNNLETSSDMSTEKEKFRPEAGASKGLTLMLDAHSNLLSVGSISDDFTGFIAAVNDKKQFPSTSEQSVLIRPGHSNSVAIQVTKFSASPNIKKYPANKRTCYFDDEIQFLTFHYSFF